MSNFGAVRCLALRFHLKCNHVAASADPCTHTPNLKKIGQCAAKLLIIQPLFPRVFTEAKS